MAFFGVEVKKSVKNKKIVEDFNKRVYSGNPVLVMFQGKASLLRKWRKEFIVFNISVNPFEIPFYKYFLYYMFKRSLKKSGIEENVRLLGSKEFEKLLRCFI